MTPSRIWILLLIGCGSLWLGAWGDPSLAKSETFSWQQSPPPAPAGLQTPTNPSQSQTLSLQDRADIFMARKLYADAVDYYLRALRESKYSDPVLWNKLGIAYQQQMNFREARRSYNQALKNNKESSEAWNNIGTTWYMQNKFGKSVKYYLRALKIEPNSASFHLNLGTSYYHMKKYTEAVEAYRTALSLDPNILSERSSVATVLETKGAGPEFYFYVAKVFASLGRPEEAVRYLRHAFEDGFTDHKKINQDPDFQKIGQNPAFIELMNNLPIPIKD
jgi:tetratricopeptide (TPR) repeat protein